MSLLQIAAPDLTAVAYGGATLQLLEGLGFSQDGATLLVRATFTDDADGGGKLHYAMWTYDLVLRQYTASLNALVTPEGGNPADTEVNSALIVGSGEQQIVVIESSVRGAVGGSILSMLSADAVTDTNALISVLGPDIAPRIERYSLSQDGRFLALQTDSHLLATDAAPDGNSVSDIYLLDLVTHQTQRVSFVENAEVYAPVQLGNVYSDGAQVQVAFSSAAAFVTADKNGTALSTEAQTDAYVWRSSFDAAGLTGAPTFQLVSARADGTAAGFVGGDVDVLATASSVYFSSTSAELVANDKNDAMDVFSLSKAGLVERVALSGVSELSSGASLLSASSDGRVLGLLTSSEEVAGPEQLQQVLVVDTQSADWRVASSASTTVLANDIVLNGALTPDGRSIAFTSNADNLVPGPAPAMAGSLYVTSTELTPSASIDLLAYSWKAHTLLEGVAISGGAYSGATNASGALSFTGVTESNLTLTVARPVPAAEVAATDSAVNLQDAIAILKMIVGLDVNGTGKPLSPYQTLAADFDGNGAVGLTDAIGVLKHVVGLNAPDPIWHFLNEVDPGVPSKTGLNPGVPANTINAELGSGQVHIGLVAYLSGDVDGSFAGAAGALDLDATQPGYFQELTSAQGLHLSQFGVYSA